MRRAPVVVLLCLVILPALSCDGGEGAALPAPSFPTLDPAPRSSAAVDWPLRRHPSMALWDAAYAAWMERWRSVPALPPLVSTTLSVDEARAVTERVGAGLPPTPLPRPFRVPAREEVMPAPGDPYRAIVERGEQGARFQFLVEDALAPSVLWLRPGESLRGLLFFGHYLYPPPPEAAAGEDYRILCLLDFRQVPFRLDGVEAIFHNVHMGPNEERAFRLEFSHLPTGFHSLLCLAYAAPDAFPQSWDSSAYDSWAQLMVANERLLQALVLVGEETAPQVTYVPLAGTLPATPQMAQALMLNRSAAEEDAWRDTMPEVWEGSQLIRWGPVEAAPGERVEVVLRANNDGSEPFRFGVTAFLDYQQVPLRVGDVDPVSWYELAAGRQEVVPISFQAPQYPGPHVYFVVRFLAPYEPAAAYEWAGDAVRFPWFRVEDESGVRSGAVLNAGYAVPVSAFFGRIPLRVVER